jgi:hypothetical protein
MARFLPSPLVSSLTGSLGGITFRRGPAGPVISSKPVKSPPPSAARDVRRQATAWLNRTWKSQDAAYRSAWNTYAKFHPVSNRFGQQCYLSGFAAFFSFAMSQILLGEAYAGSSHTWPTPGSDAVTFPTVVLYTLTAGAPWPTVDANLILPPGPAAFAVCFWCCRQLRATCRHPRSWTYLGYNVSTGGSTDISSLFETAEIQLVAGETVAMRSMCDSGYWTLPSKPTVAYTVVG